MKGKKRKLVFLHGYLLKIIIQYNLDNSHNAIYSKLILMPLYDPHSYQIINARTSNTSSQIEP